MHDLSPELGKLTVEGAAAEARAAALRLERREIFSVHRELLVMLYAGVATVVAGVGLLVKANLDRIGPVALLSGILLASLLCYLVAARAQRKGRQRHLGEDYVLLLGALLFSAAVGYAEFRFRLLGAVWARHLLLLAAWHLATAYFFRSRLVLSVALTAFATWMGAELQFGALFEPGNRWWGAGPRALCCAIVFYAGSRLHVMEDPGSGSGFREVYRQFAVHFGFWGALALGADGATRWLGAVTLLALAVASGRVGLAERRESYLVYAVGYSTIGLIWLEALLLRGFGLTSTLGLMTVIGAVALLFSLRARLKASTP
ncbi:MAG TPA: DUF2157 domain-containing protein [Steroidobacteraceae bacterium]|nr:DUF2157 domain-containing protein [Steroidobacteraceae bacterium]